MTKRWVRTLLWCLTLGMMAVIFLFSSQGGEESMATSGQFAIPLTNWITSMMGGMSPEAYDELLVTVQLAVRKTAHFSEYAILGMLIHLLMASYQTPRTALWAWLAATGYAATDELHQLLGGERTGMWQDVALDGCGALAGIILTGLVIRFLRRRAEKQA